MTARSIRRSQQRTALKDMNRAALKEQSDARQQEQRDALATGGPTGPRTPEGKAKSSLNAVKTALTGGTVLLPSDDAALYEQHLQQFADQFQPVGPLERNLVQSLADTAWRLMRIPALEMAIYASGHEKFADRFAGRDPALRNNLIQMETFLFYEKQLRNLQIQEGRLRRNREKDAAELSRLQHERGQKEEADRKAAAKRDLAERNSSKPSMLVPGKFYPEFVFATEDTHRELEHDAGV